MQIPLTAPLRLWCDNLGALALTFNPIFHATTKHIDVDHIRSSAPHQPDKNSTIAILKSIDSIKAIATYY